MKSKTTVFLVIALMLCIAYAAVWRGGLFAPSGGDPVAENAGPLFSQPPGKPAELTIVPQGGERMKFVKSQGAWRIAEPIATAAIDENIRTLIDTLVSITRLQRYETADPKAPDASVTGLDKPRWTVTLTDDKQKTFGLKIGQHVPLSGNTRTYVQLAGDERICVAAGDFTETMSQPTSYYRSRRMLEIPSDKIMSLQVAGRETYSIQRKLENEWLIASETGKKEEFDADRREIDTLVNRFARIDASEFIDDNPSDLAPYGLHPGGRRLAVSVTFMPKNAANAKTASLILGQQTGNAGRKEVFAKLAGRATVFTLPASMLDDLQPSTLKLRNKTILPIIVK